MEIDYRILLVKYMAQVLDAEGVSFIWEDKKILSEDEVKELRKIEKEAVKFSHERWGD